jgi:hypothetical protein
MVFEVEVTWLDVRLKDQSGYTEEDLVDLDVPHLASLTRR